MSPSVAPGRTAFMPSHMASYVTSTSRCAFTGTSPRTYIRLVSPCQPSRITVTSMLTMSPRARRFSLGMPWQTTWLMEVQMDLGKPR